MANTLRKDSFVHFLGSEVIAGDGIPSEPSPHVEAAVFSAKHQQRGVFAGHLAGPEDRVLVAIVAEHRKVRITVLGQTDLLGVYAYALHSSV